MQFLTLLASYTFSVRKSPDLEEVFTLLFAFFAVAVILWVVIFAIIKAQKSQTNVATSTDNCRIIENAVVLEKNQNPNSGWLQFTVENLDTHERTILRIDPTKNQGLATIQVGEKGRVTMSTGAPYAAKIGELLVAFVIKE